MKIKNLLTLLLFLFISFVLQAQGEDHTILNSCFTDHLHEQMLIKNYKYATNHQRIEQQLFKIKNEGPFSSSKFGTTLTIPIVVHIIHQNGPENISDGQVFDAILHLNDAFKNVGFYNPDTGVDTEIDFCLAMRGPQNNVSNGVNRIESALTNVTIETQDLDLKALLQWNPLDYLNIWVVKEIISESSGSGVAGYAYFPAAHGFPQDGIVVEAGFMGSSQDFSKVLVHEAGHYLGLYHTFEGGCTNDDCRINGDRICDTPPDQSTAPVDCGADINTCSTDEDDTSDNNPFRAITLGGLGDQNDMYINYMDYGHLPCYSAFTEGQKERMQNALTTSRKSLLFSFGCQSPCPISSYTASFISNPTSPVLASEVVEFTNTSDPADLYEWSIDNQVISTSENSSYTFNEEGLFNVQLLIRDTINFCVSSIEQTVEVVCEGDASFSTTSTNILAGETLSFTNTSTGNNSYQWFLDGVEYSTDLDITITFSNPGIYSLYLVGTTSTCLNYSSTITIMVGSCAGEDKSEMNWYFGENAALDFNNGEPVTVLGSQLNVNEGSACISDDNGELLFYTDGINIWDKTNTVMPNGTNLLGGANTSAWNQALIVPRPQRPEQFYVFTNDDFENGVANGINYSIVDMTLNNGLGDVTNVKNVFLCPANVETMNAAYHDDGQRAWLVIPDHDVLNTYLIDANGISPAIPFSIANYESDWGFGRFFNSGKKLILSQADIFNSTIMVILDFDNKTGAFSNPIEIDTGFEVWSFEVSSDDSKLYAILGISSTEFNLYQFDLSLTTVQQIINSKTLIGSLDFFDRMLLAPNGKIYTTVFNTQYLNAINDPNALGADCDFEARSVDISPAINFLSLPKFIRGQRYSDFSIPIIDLGTDQNICNGLTTVLDPGGNENYNFIWQDGSTNSTFTAWLPGTYWVTASNVCGSITDSITITLDQLDLVDLGDDITLCMEEEVMLDAGANGDFYLWQDGSISSTFMVTNPGLYWVEVSSLTGCYQGDSILITLDNEPPIVDCPMDLDTVVFSGTSQLFLNPGLPLVTDSCPYILENDFTNSNDAATDYPIGSTTLTWTVTDENGNTTTCTMDITIDVMSGIEDVNNTASLILYPNPSDGLFILENTQNNINDILLTVLDPLGQKIYEKKASLNGKVFIDLTEEAQGVYFLHWFTNNNSGVFKLINK